MSRFAPAALLAIVVMLSAPALATPTSAPAPDPAAEAVRLLPIAPRSHAPDAPREGWCGETAIQESLLHLGVWAPQRLINKAGRPVHPDLYSPDIPVALGELGVRYTVYPGGKGFDAYAQWVRAALDAGDPVLAGVKILPTEHPEWGLDHFVLVVGHGPKGLLVNTTWGHRRWVADTTTPGLSFKNAFYGIRLLGLSGSARVARLAVLEEGPSAVKLRVTCAGVEEGASYRLERRSARGEANAAWSEVFAGATPFEKVLTVDADRASRFRCVAL